MHIKLLEQCLAHIKSLINVSYLSSYYFFPILKNHYFTVSQYMNVMTGNLGQNALSHHGQQSKENMKVNNRNQGKEKCDSREKKGK